MGTRAILFESAQTYLSTFQGFLAETPESIPSSSFPFYRYSFLVDLKVNTDGSCVEPQYKYKFCVCATRRRAGALDEDVASDNEENTIRYTANIIGVLPMIRAMVACPTWTHGKFVFEHDSPIDPSFVPFLDSLMFEMFSLLRFHPSLTSLDIQFNRFSGVHVRPLLCLDLSIQTLILTPGAMEVPYHAKSIVEYLSRNSVLKSCTLGLDSCDFKCHPQFLGIILSPFTTSRPSKANVVLKELVLRMASSKVPQGLWEESVAKLVHCSNTSLQKLELLFSPECSDNTSASKVWFNRELEEFGFVCSTDELSLLENRVGIFDPSLTTLKLCPASPLFGKDFMQSLRYYLMRDYLSLKHVHVSAVTMGQQPWTTWENSSDDARDVELGTQEMLKSMVSLELRLNATLQSLVVGNWKLLRVGTEWQTSYGGPCLLFSGVAEEHYVKVKMRRRARQKQCLGT